MNYIREFKGILTSTHYSVQRMQQKLDHLAHNSLPSHIHPNSKNTFNILKRKVAYKIKQLESKLQTASGGDKKDLEARLKELKSVQKEFKKIEQSVTMYSFVQSTEPYFDYNAIGDTGTVFYDGTLGSLINELKHVFQFETGQLEFIGVGGTSMPGLTYDIFDELETYKRQYAFDGLLKLNISLSESDVMGLMMSTNTKDMGRIEIKKMKDIKVAIIAKVADSFLKDGLYKRISKKKLDISSSAKDVFNANK